MSSPFPAGFLRFCSLSIPPSAGLKATHPRAPDDARPHPKDYPMTTTPTLGNAGSVGFVAHADLIAAIDQAAAERGVTRSHFVRHRIAEWLKEEGRLDPDTPTTNHDERRRRTA